MPVLPDWPASPWTVRCGRTSISTVTLLVGGDSPWLTPIDTPGAIYFPALSAVAPVEDLVVVHSGKATLVARKDQLDKLKALVEGLNEAGYESYL